MQVFKHLPPTPAALTVELLQGRWTTSILYQLMEGPLRYSQIQQRIPQVSAKVLAQQLRVLEHRGLLARRVTAQVPVRVDYSMTELGARLRPLLKQLCDWGSFYADARGEPAARHRCV